MPNILLALALLIGGGVWAGHAEESSVEALPSQSRPFNQARENRTLVVLALPSIWDSNYSEDFAEIADFQIELARIIHEQENVVVLVDRHTMPYVDGRAELLKQHLPADALIEANVYDPNLHDFAPLGVGQFVKFIYSAWTDIASKQVDDSINKFLMDQRVRLDKREQDLVLSGRDLVDNGINKAIISNKVIDDNLSRVPEWAALIKLYSSFKKVLMISPPHVINQTRLRLDDIIAFIDEEMVVVTSLPSSTVNSSSTPTTLEQLQQELHRKFRKDIMLVDLPSWRRPDEEGNCGLYSAILSTNKNIYAPVFGSRPEHWRYGYSSSLDRHALQVIETNTHKRVVPVSIPRAVCRRGLSMRSMAWTVKGRASDVIIDAARRRFKVAAVAA